MGKRDVVFSLNDYELLYLATYNDEEAKNLILKKYEKLIYKYNQKFDVDINNYDDFLQEGRIIINKAIKTFDVNSNKSFTKYVELLLYHRYIDLMRKKKTDNYQLISDESIDYVCFDNTKTQTVSEEIIIDYDDLSQFERQIYHYRFEKLMKPRDIAGELEIPINKIYSALERIKRKLRK